MNKFNRWAHRQFRWRSKTSLCRNRIHSWWSSNRWFLKFALCKGSILCNNVSTSSKWMNITKIAFNWSLTLCSCCNTARQKLSLCTESGRWMHLFHKSSHFLLCEIFLFFLGLFSFRCISKTVIFLFNFLVCKIILSNYPRNIFEVVKDMDTWIIIQRTYFDLSIAWQNWIIVTLSERILLHRWVREAFTLNSWRWFIQLTFVNHCFIFLDLLVLWKYKTLKCGVRIQSQIRRTHSWMSFRWPWILKLFQTMNLLSEFRTSLKRLIVWFIFISSTQRTHWLSIL